jgi:ammonia channel protein AmtB
MKMVLNMYDENVKAPFKPASVTDHILGAFILFICWLAFNAGSGFGISHKRDIAYPPRVVMNTILSAAAAALTVVFIKPMLNK